MTTDDKAKWIERARKLFAHAESAKAIGSEAEAESFMAGLQKMLTAQKLDWSVLSAQEQEELDPLMHTWHTFDEVIGRKKRRQAWVEKLAAAVAHAHFCEIVVATQSNAIMFVGRTSDVQICRYMITMLVRIGKEGADKAYRKERYHKWKQDVMHEAHGYRSAFLLGYTERLGERLRALHRREVESDRRMSLVLVRSKEEITKYQDSKLNLFKAAAVGMSARGLDDTIERGREAGRHAADQVNLNTRVVGGSSSKDRHLGRVPGQLGKGGDK